MTDVLKGNFKTQRDVKVADQAGENLEDRFEKEALKKLGGSIAFVSKKRVTWDLPGEANKKPESDK